MDAGHSFDRLIVIEKTALAVDKAPRPLLLTPSMRLTKQKSFRITVVFTLVLAGIVLLFGAGLKISFGVLLVGAAIAWMFGTRNITQTSGQPGRVPNANRAEDVSTDAVFCVHCGKDNPTYAAFCRRCGKETACSNQ